MISAEEKSYLRDLAKQVKEISQNEIWKEKDRLWRKLNSLQGERPMIICAVTDECWPEIISGKDLKIEDPYLRAWEYDLKKKIYRWNNIHDDVIITDKIFVPIEYEFTDWVEGRRRPYAANKPYESNGKTAEAFHPCILEYDDWDKLVCKPELKYIDWKKTEDNMNLLDDIFGGNLQIIKGEPFYSSIDTTPTGWGTSAIDILCELRGLEEIMYDVIDAPEFVHMAMSYLVDCLSDYLDTLESEGLLRINNDAFWKNTNTPLGSNGFAITDELPGDDFDPSHIKTQDLWGYCQAQEFALVSPAMEDEFVIQHQKKLAERFGLISYGCCESNDYKYDYLINAFPNLREISVSHAADIRIAAEKLKRDYVISWKPHATLINNFDREKVSKFMNDSFNVLKDNNVSCSLRDVLTIHGHPEYFGMWTDVAMEAAKQYERK
ncbi:MAG: hypothetical protein Q4F31_02960 [Eubacteriales bacterium]|nr:hypothetical protein [Eubacteriales bacterium]